MKIDFTFFGTSKFSVLVLEKLKENGFVPSLIITTEDKPKGRKLTLTPPEVKAWAIKENTPFIQLKSLKDSSGFDLIKEKTSSSEVFIVASYGKIIPQNILDLPKFGTLNVHPSLLPKLRGASPIQSSILEENETGVTIIKLDAEMDHGPIITQEKVEVADWPPYADKLEEILGQKGGEILSEILPDWISGKIEITEQDHNKATFCKKIEKEDGQINLEDNPETNLRKIRAYNIWPVAFTFYKHKEKTIRLSIKSARLEDGKLILEKVIPEGKKEMDFDAFINGLH